MHAICLGLSIPVWNSVFGANRDALPTAMLWAAFVLFFLTSGITRKSWGIYFGTALEVFVLVLTWRFTELLLLNMIFAALWVWAVRIGTKIDSDRNASS